jgi:hypothetical protein
VVAAHCLVCRSRTKHQKFGDIAEEIPAEEKWSFDTSQASTLPNFPRLEQPNDSCQTHEKFPEKQLSQNLK